MRFLTFNKDLRVFFSEENPQLNALEAFENTYNNIDNVFFVLAPKDGQIYYELIDQTDLDLQLLAGKQLRPQVTNIDRVNR